MAKMKIEVGQGGDIQPGEIEVTLTMRGPQDKVVNALIHGLPREALLELAGGIQRAMGEVADAAENV